MGFGVWEGLQSIGNGCGLQMDGFSAHFEPSGFIFKDFHDCCHFVVFSGGLKNPQKNYYSSEKPSRRVESPVVGWKAQ